MVDVLPPYQKEELPRNMPTRFRSDMAALHRATNSFMPVVHRYELHRAISRNPEFVAKINNTRTAYAMTTISGALISTLVVSLSALFDDDPDAVSLKRVLNTLVHPESLGPLQEHHRAGIVDVETILARLKRIRSRLNRDPLKGAIIRLRDLRNQEAAHIDIELSLANGRPVFGHLDLVYAVAANIIFSCNFVAGSRYIPVAQIRYVARLQADLFRRSIVPI